MRRLAALCVAPLLVLQASAARAYPFLALHPGGTPFEGPTDPELSAVFYNPAALGPLRGAHIGGVGQLVVAHGSVDRDPICLDTGQPGSGCTQSRSFPSAKFADVSGAGLGGLVWDFRNENLALALITYAPWESHRSFASAGNGAAGSTDTPTAYHLRREDFTLAYVALGASFKLSRIITVGVNVSAVDGVVSLAFDRDTALEPHNCPNAARAADGSCSQPTWPGGSTTIAEAGYENPAYAERLQLRGDGGKFWGGIPTPTGLSIGVGGLLKVSERLMLGASWTRMFPLFVSAGRFGVGDLQGASVQPAAKLDPAKVCGESGTCTGSAVIAWDVPDVYYLGARWKLREDLDFATTVRLVMYGGYQRSARERAIVLQLAGDPVERAGTPSRILLGRSLVPAFAGEAAFRWRMRDNLRIGFSVAGETSAVPGIAVSPEALDGPKVDLLVGVEMRVSRTVRVYGGYDFTGTVFTALNRPSPGSYDPRAAVRCVDASYALDACAATLDGRGLPTAAGSYTLVTHHINLGAFVDF